MRSGETLVNKESTLVIAHIDTLSTETFAKNGEQKLVGVVVKNTPFRVEISLPSDCAYNFRQLSITTELLYDCPSEKQVDFVRHKPLDYKLVKVNEAGDLATLEVRMKVLSSQLEDMHFKLRFHAIFNSTTVPHSFYCTSGSLKVVSKPDQVGKKPATRPPKRSRAELMQESLHRIEQQQQEHLQFLSSLLQPSAKKRYIPDPNLTFKKAMLQLFAELNKLPEPDRAVKIQRVVRSLDVQQRAILSEMTGMLQSELVNTFQDSSATRACGLDSLLGLPTNGLELLSDNILLDFDYAS